MTVGVAAQDDSRVTRDDSKWFRMTVNSRLKTGITHMKEYYIYLITNSNKGWSRKKKDTLINAFNSEWKDLYLDFY
ncbi:MAG: hypothetical protein WAW86_01460, partial [Gammaproteobacteria bacterium]